MKKSKWAAPVAVRIGYGSAIVVLLAWSDGALANRRRGGQTSNYYHSPAVIAAPAAEAARPVAPPAEEDSSAVKPDSRCLRLASLDLNDAKAVRKHNRLCAIEQEVIRLTNVQRKRVGLPELRPNPELSFILRRQAELNYAGHGYFQQGWTRTEYDRQFGKDSPLTLQAENAWPPAAQGNTVEDIAFNLADSRAAASDGQPKGWNHHPGHAANVVNPNATEVGVGVYELPNGAVQAFTVFARPR